MPLVKAAKYGYLSARCRTMRSQLIDHETLRELAASRTIGELYSGLSSTPYAPFITAVTSEGIHRGLSEAFAHQRDKLIRGVGKPYKAVFNLFFVAKYALVDEKTVQMHCPDPQEVFRQIDMDHIGLLKKSLLTLPAAEQRQLKKMVGSYFDLLNLYNLVKFRLLYRQSVEETLLYMLPYGERFKLEELALLCDAGTIEQLSRSVEPVLGEGFDDYETFRKVLYRYHRQQLQSVWSGYPFSIALPFSLLRLIEIEIMDLRAITEGVAFGFAGSEIMAMTVGG
jgi:vacuolar-type H+-ATPase subunit C/Vma6